MAGKLDVVLADEVNFDFYAKQGFFQDLSFLLSKEELAHYQENLYYIDHPYDIENKPVPIGIKIDKTNKITETACYPNTSAYFGIVANSEHADNALLYLNYLENK